MAEGDPIRLEGGHITHVQVVKPRYDKNGEETKPAMLRVVSEVELERAESEIVRVMRAFRKDTTVTTTLDWPEQQRIAWAKAQADLNGRDAERAKDVKDATRTKPFGPRKKERQREPAKT